jgi:hypothetical protein
MRYVKNMAFIREITRMLSWCMNSIGQNAPCETRAQVCGKGDDITIDVREEGREWSGLDFSGSI